MREHRIDSVLPREPIKVAPEPSVTELEVEPAWTARAGRRNSREKFAAGLRGLKHAIRGDSSFFAHAYRGTLIAMTAALLGVDPLGWCLLVISATFVLLAELTNSAVDTLARAGGNEEDPPFKMAREIAAGGVLVAAFASGGLTITVLTVKFGEMFGWWGH
jgi:diacylglycerol kinase